MIDLPQTQNDEKNAIKIAKSMGIRDEDIMIFRDMNKQQLIEKHREVQMRVNMHSGQQ